MLLYAKRKMEELMVDDIYFFRMAYEWCFHKDVDPTLDVAEFRLNGHMPKYVVRFVKYLQKTDLQ